MKIDWEERVLKDAYPECSNVGLSYEELYQEFKKRFLEEVVAEEKIKQRTHTLVRTLELRESDLGK